MRTSVEKAARAARNLIGTWLRRIRERSELSRMTARELRDARISPYDARIEMNKPFWRD